MEDLPRSFLARALAFLARVKVIIFDYGVCGKSEISRSIFR